MWYVVTDFGGDQVREHIPLKQGLRRGRGPYLGDICSQGQRAYSIKTRIKTLLLWSQGLPNTLVREHIPLKQGLRR